MIENFIQNTTLLTILVTLITAASGSLVFLKLKIPAGPILGSMFTVMLLSIFWGKSLLPESMATVAKIAAGTLIGSKISRNYITVLKKITVPLIAFAILILGLSISAGLIIFNTSTLQKVTALFGSAPGGVSDMALISLEFDADMSRVAILQTIRLIVCIVGIPIIVNRVNNKKPRNIDNSPDCGEGILPIENIVSQNEQSPLTSVSRNKTVRSFLTAVVGTLGGLLGNYASIPAGSLTGAILFVSLFNIFISRLYVSKRISLGIQMLMGAVIGASMSMEDVLGIKEVILPVIMIAVFMLAIGVSLGFMLHKIWKIDFPTALISTSPGGMTSLSIIAPELGVNMSIVATMHLIRLLAVVIIYPLIIRFIM